MSIEIISVLIAVVCVNLAWVILGRLDIRFTSSSSTQ